jgi:hypothetical protein
MRITSGFARHIARDRFRAPARLFDLAHELFGCVAVAQVVHAHRVAALRREARGRRADSAPTSRDEHHACRRHAHARGGSGSRFTAATTMPRTIEAMVSYTTCWATRSLGYGWIAK